MARPDAALPKLTDMQPYRDTGMRTVTLYVADGMNRSALFIPPAGEVLGNTRPAQMLSVSCHLGRPDVTLQATAPLISDAEWRVQNMLDARYRVGTGPWQGLATRFAGVDTDDDGEADEATRFLVVGLHTQTILPALLRGSGKLTVEMPGTPSGVQAVTLDLAGVDGAYRTVLNDCRAEPGSVAEQKEQGAESAWEAQPGGEGQPFRGTLVRLTQRWDESGANRSTLDIPASRWKDVDAGVPEPATRALRIACWRNRPYFALLSSAPYLTEEAWQAKRLPEAQWRVGGGPWRSARTGRVGSHTDGDRELDRSNVQALNLLDGALLAPLVAGRGPVQLRVQDTPSGEQRMIIPTTGIGAAYQEGAQSCRAKDGAQ